MAWSVLSNEIPPPLRSEARGSSALRKLKPLPPPVSATTSPSTEATLMEPEYVYDVFAEWVLR